MWTGGAEVEAAGEGYIKTPVLLPRQQAGGSVRNARVVARSARSRAATPYSPCSQNVTPACPGGGRDDEESCRLEKVQSSKKATWHASSVR